MHGRTHLFAIFMNVTRWPWFLVREQWTLHRMFIYDDNIYPVWKKYCSHVPSSVSSHTVNHSEVTCLLSSKFDFGVSSHSLYCLWCRLYLVDSISLRDCSFSSLGASSSTRRRLVLTDVRNSSAFHVAITKPVINLCLVNNVWKLFSKRSWWNNIAEKAQCN